MLLSEPPTEGETEGEKFVVAFWSGELAVTGGGGGVLGLDGGLISLGTGGTDDDGGRGGVGVLSLAITGAVIVRGISVFSSFGDGGEADGGILVLMLFASLSLGY